nr:hypothetical protein [Entomoplasma sp. MP1]
MSRWNSVEVGEVQPGINTEYQQEIIFKGNGTKNNKFLYSGEVAMDYY